MKLSFTPLVLRKITLAVLALLALVFAYQVANSSSTDNVVGWAWAGNVESWISLNNCNSGGTCTGPNYGLKIDFATGELSGYIWSDNYGFISFNRGVTNNPPSAPFNGGSGPIASYSSTTGQITGWARALAGCQNTAGSPAVSCASTSAGTNAGGWDGWIKLSGTGTDSSTYGLSYSAGTNKITGYAWGGSDAIGWINFTDANVLPLPVITFTATPSSIYSGATSSLTWLPVVGATSCTASGDWTGEKSVSGGTEPVGPLTSTKIYTLSCIGAGGTATKDVTVTVSEPPSGTLTATGCTIAKGGTSCSSTVVWTSSGFVGGTSVRQNSVEFNTLPSSSQSRDIGYGNTSFTMVDTGGTFSVEATAAAACVAGSTWTDGSCVDDSILSGPPSGTITATPCEIAEGGTSCPSTVAWDSDNFTAASVEQGDVQFSTEMSDSVSRNVSPDDATFTLLDAGINIATANAMVTCVSGSTWRNGSCMVDPTTPPDISIIAKPHLVRSGSAATVEITVDSAYAVTCTMKGLTTASFPHLGTPSFGVYAFSTATLRSAQIVSVVCDYDDYDLPTSEETDRVNVIPIAQEI